MKAMSAHGVHSPFVYDLIHSVLEDRRHFYAFDEIAQLRQTLYQDQSLLNIEDFGAGSHSQNTKQRIVCDIARTAGRTDKFGRLLFRLVQHYGCKHILELGTSVGLGTSYLGIANREAHLTTIEGSPEIAARATKSFRQLKLDHIQQVVGNFDRVFEDVLKSSPPIDLLFIDGNHRQEPTVRYFQQALNHMTPDGMMIFDDIHWSPGMQAAWDEIKAHPSVTLSVDLFFIGIVWFRKEIKVKQDFVLKY